MCEFLSRQIYEIRKCFRRSRRKFIRSSAGSRRDKSEKPIRRLVYSHISRKRSEAKCSIRIASDCSVTMARE